MESAAHSSRMSTRARKHEKASLEARRVSLFDDAASLSKISVASESVSERSLKLIADLEEQHRKRVMQLEYELQIAKSGRHNVDNRNAATSPILDSYLVDCAAQQLQHSVRNVEDTKTLDVSRDLLKALSNLCLPKVELDPFDGNPIDYVRFVRQFEYFVEAKVADVGQRLLQFMHYCRGKAKDAIKECIMLEPTEAYARAHAILKQLFGRPHLIARAMIDDLLTGLKQPLDSNALSSLAIKMQNCHIALKEIRSDCDLNAPHVLESIVRTLPFPLRSRWAEEADRLNMMSREPTFVDLSEFIMDRSRVASSRFGLLAERSTTSKQPSGTYKNESYRSNLMIANQERKNRNCRLCNLANHPLYSCAEFTQCEIKERWSIAKRMGVCFKCLGYYHISKNCKVDKKCSINGCSASHHVLLHQDRAMRDNDDDTSEAAHVCTTTTERMKTTRLGVIPVKVQTTSGLVPTLALLDPGSDTSLIKERFLDQCGLKSNPTSLIMTTVNGIRNVQCRRLSIQIVSYDEQNVIDINEVFTVDDLPVKPVPSICEEAKRWPHLVDIPFEENLDNTEVCILIGCDVPEVHWAIEQRTSYGKQPYALKTLLGWTLFGPSRNRNRHFEGNFCVSTEEVTLKDQINLLYNAEFLDASSTIDTLSQEDKYVLRITEAQTQHVNGHFQVPIPWKADVSRLFNNYSQATRRLLYLKRKLLQNIELRDKYIDGMNRLIAKGYLELVSPSEPNNDRTWYMPHHAVFHPKKKDKIRIVFDCAAKYKDVSLNDCILSGPDTNNPLVKVLLRFRIHPIAVTADIEEMFLQVGVPKQDRDASRVLWWPDTDLHAAPVIYRETKRALDGLNQEELSRKLTMKEIQWHFNPPYSSHRSGIWERMIRSIRRIMHSLLSEQSPSDESLNTVMVEAERILNSRPIVPVTPSDSTSLALTPNDLLLLRSSVGMEHQDSLVDRYRSGWKHANYLAGVFWRRWSKEYLSTLLLRQKWLYRGRNMKVGDVVLIKGEKHQRNNWPLGRIIDVKNDSDGLVRTVTVRTSKGDMVRDVRSLCF